MTFVGAVPDTVTVTVDGVLGDAVTVVVTVVVDGAGLVVVGVLLGVAVNTGVVGVGAAASAVRESSPSASPTVSNASAARQPRRQWLTRRRGMPHPRRRPRRTASGHADKDERVQILSFPEAETPPALRAQVIALQQQAWPGPGTGLTHDPALHPMTVLLVSGGVVVAALDVLSKSLTHRGETYRVSGLSTVVTARTERRSGHGTRLVRAAHELVAESGVDLALFTCDRELAGFYLAAGWTLLRDTVLIGGTPADQLCSDAPGFDKVTLGDFFSANARRNADTFLGTRIELYPGTIDRLW